ncbi:MAG: DUF4340 domain-containing protein [Kiritimatiellia bacterium]|jgi:hypothetical protein|nr:DUF4340 domain-containing protein [Kiritimatiellia bacterium]MDD4173963.1 DUF4340 domain-containing protein [Kiritimatiellia bacterium]MDX9794534.1 DUF4340 domain-containing protein [Kiritimatiellia bacterium]
MTNKKLVTLTAAAAVLVGLAYLSSSSKKVKTPSLVGKPVVKKFDLSAVAKIETGPTDKKLVLASTDAGWVIESLHGYPADIAKIRENLLKLTDLKAGHVASGKKLENPALVDLQDAAGKSLATLRLGDKHMRQPAGEMAQFGGGGYPDGRYVAADGSDTVVLVKDSLDAFDGDAKSWTETQIAAVPSADVTAAELTRDGRTVKLAKKDGAWTLDGLGAKEELDTSKTYSLESALNYLNFNTVVDPALTDAQLGLTTGAVFTVALKSGERYTAKVGGVAEGGTDRYIRLSAAFTPVGTNATENAELTKKVETFNAKSGKWAYTVSSYNAENMTKSRADLVKAKEEPKKEDEKADK